tara:strand:- start:29219 stop:29830 length:612 start_codon:yes stop_codon:yes gene_type:complete
MNPGPNGSTPPTEQDKSNQVKRLKDQVADTTEVVLDTIDQLVERGENLEDLVDQTGQTEDKALEFTGNARKMLVKAKFKSWALSAAMVGGIVGGFYGLSVGASIPMLLASSGMVGALFYGVMWMCSGIIQSGMRLPFLGFSFQPAVHKDDYKEAQKHGFDTAPKLDSFSPVFVSGYQFLTDNSEMTTVNISGNPNTEKRALKL